MADESEDRGWKPKPPEEWARGQEVYVLMANESPEVILARIDERTRNMNVRMDGVESDIREIKLEMGKTYVSQEAFKNLQAKVSLHEKILFGAVALILVAVMGALIKLVLVPSHGGL